MEDNPVFKDEFYIKKFMVIQQQNVVLSDMLKRIHADSTLAAIVQEKFGPEFFDILKDTPA